MTLVQSVSIDPYHEHLGPALAALNTLAFSPDWGERWSDKDLLGALSLPGVTAFVARSGEDALCGFLLARTIVDEAEILLIGVLPQSRGKGIGSALMAHFFNHARSCPLQRVFLEVREGNQPARLLYERMGFRQIGRRDGYYRTKAGKSTCAITLAKYFSST